MLDTLEEKVNDVHDNVLNINEQMKVTLEKVCHLLSSLVVVLIVIAAVMFVLCGFE